VDKDTPTFALSHFRQRGMFLLARTCFFLFFAFFVLYLARLRFRLSPSFLPELKPLISGYVFLHFCPLFAFDLIVGSALC